MGVGDGVAVQAVRQRGARQERLHEGPAALPLQGLRAELHRHPAARPAAAGQGHRRPAVPERARACPGPDPGMNRTAKLLGVSTPSVMAWIEQFAKAYAQKPEPEGRALLVELDEMWHFLKKAEQALGLEGSGSCYRTDHRLGAGRP